jgi:hypothetical protein
LNELGVLSELGPCSDGLAAEGGERPASSAAAEAGAAWCRPRYLAQHAGQRHSSDIVPPNN